MRCASASRPTFACASSSRVYAHSRPSQVDAATPAAAMILEMGRFLIFISPFLCLVSCGLRRRVRFDRAQAAPGLDAIQLRHDGATHLEETQRAVLAIHHFALLVDDDG